MKKTKVMAILILMTIVLLSQGLAAEPIEITKGPENVSVNVNGSATFPCQYTGTRRQPFWYIRGNQYSLENPPPRHLFLHGNVTIYNVHPSDNGSTYQCTFFTVWSDIAILTVIAPETTAPTIEVTATRVSSNSVQQHFSAVFSTTTASQLLLPTPAMNTTGIIPRGKFKRSTFVTLVSLGVACVLLVTAGSIVCLCGCLLHFKRKQQAVTAIIYADVGPPATKAKFTLEDSNCQDAIYTEIEDPLSLDKNDAYGIVVRHSRELETGWRTAASPPSPHETILRSSSPVNE